MKSISNELDINFDVIASQLSRYCDVINKRLWRYHQDEDRASEIKIVVLSLFMDSLCRVRNKIIYALSWRTVSALTRVFFLCSFPELRSNDSPLVSAETVYHSHKYIIIYLFIRFELMKLPALVFKAGTVTRPSLVSDRQTWLDAKKRCGQQGSLSRIHPTTWNEAALRNELQGFVYGCVVIWLYTLSRFSFNSLATGRFQFNFRHFQTNFSEWWLRYLSWNSPQMNATRPYWC